MSELAQLQTKNKRLQERNDELLSGAAQLEADLAESLKQNHLLVKRLRAAESDVRRLREAEGAPKPVDMHIPALKQQNRTLARTNKVLAAENEKLTGDLNTILGELEALEGEAALTDDLKQALLEKDRGLTTREERLNRVTDSTLKRLTQAERMRQKAEESKRKRDEAPRREMELRVQNAALMGKIEKLEKALFQLREDDESRTPVMGRKVTAGGR